MCMLTDGGMFDDQNWNFRWWPCFHRSPSQHYVPLCAVYQRLAYNYVVGLLPTFGLRISRYISGCTGLWHRPAPTRHCFGRLSHSLLICIPTCGICLLYSTTISCGNGISDVIRALQLLMLKKLNLNKGDAKYTGRFTYEKLARLQTDVLLFLRNEVVYPPRLRAHGL